MDDRTGGNVILRDAQVGDLDLILDAIRSPEDLLMWAGPGPTWPLSRERLVADFVAVQAAGHCRTWVVVDVGRHEDVGYVEMSVSHQVGVGHISRVLIHPAARGRGLGRALMRAVITAGRDVHGLATITLNVHERNVTARSLYEHLGFEYVGHGRMADSLRMQLRSSETT